MCAFHICNAYIRGEFAYTPGPALLCLSGGFSFIVLLLVVLLLFLEVDDAKSESDAPRYSTVDGALHESTRTVLSKSRELARPNTELQTATAQHYMLSRTFKVPLSLSSDLLVML